MHLHHYTQRQEEAEMDYHHHCILQHLHHYTQRHGEAEISYVEEAAEGDWVLMDRQPFRPFKIDKLYMTM